MIARVLLILALLTGGAFAQGPILPGPGLPVAAAGFQGIGDVKATGWVAYWGSRAFSSATRGNRVANVCNSTGGTDVGCADMLSNATTGDIVPQVISGLSCPGANCTVKIWYDQSGANQCSGAPCDVTQATVANRHVLTANALGGASTKTCGVSNSVAGYSSPSLTQVNQPFSVSGVVKYASTTGSQFFIGAATAVGFGAFASSGNFILYASSAVNGSTWDTNAHALQFVANSGSSFVVVDTTTGSTGSSGGLPAQNNLYYGTDLFANGVASGGIVCEGGFNNTAFSGGDTSNLNTNQHSYWGF